MAQINRLKDSEISNGNIINADDLDAEFDQLLSESNDQDTRLGAIEGAYVTVSGTNAFTGNNSFAGKIQLKDDGELTIASGAITITGANHTIDTEADAASDDLDTISGGVDGAILIVQAENGARTVVLKHNTGNIYNPSGVDISLDDQYRMVLLVYQSALSKWVVDSVNVYASQSQAEVGTNNTELMTPLRTSQAIGALGAWQPVESQTASGATTINFVTGFGNYDYLLTASRVTTTADGIVPWIRISLDGAAFRSTAGDYAHVSGREYPSGGYAPLGSGSDTEYELTNAAAGSSLGNAAGEQPFAFEVLLLDAADTTGPKIMKHWLAGCVASDGTFCEFHGAGRFKGTNGAILGIQVGGATFSGEFKLYRRRRA